MKITASFDDGGVEDLEIAKMMTKYGIETTFYVPVLWQRVNTLKGRFSISLQELQEISKSHNIGSHTITHPHLTSIDIDQAYGEIYDSKAMLEQIVDKTITSFCYPRGYYSEPILELVAGAGYSDARTTKVGYINYPDDPFQTHTSVHVGYNRKEYDGKSWLEYGKWLFQEAKKVEEAGGDPFFHFWGHGFELGGQMDKLEEFCEAIT